MNDRSQMDLKLAADGRELKSVPIPTLIQWIGERRITPRDWVRPTGTETWVPVPQDPQLAPHLRAVTAQVRQQQAAAATAARTPATSSAATSPAALATGAATTEDLGIAQPARAPRRRDRRALEDTVMDMTPMIDVTFQLLIFFMFANQLANPDPIMVPEAQYGRGVLPEGTQAILIDESGGYYLGQISAAENRSPSLTALVREVDANSQGLEAPLEVIISAHRDARHKLVRELVEQLDQLPNIGQIRLGVEEKR